MNPRDQPASSAMLGIRSVAFVQARAVVLIVLVFLFFAAVHAHKRSNTEIGCYSIVCLVVPRLFSFSKLHEMSIADAVAQFDLNRMIITRT